MISPKYDHKCKASEKNIFREFLITNESAEIGLSGGGSTVHRLVNRDVALWENMPHFSSYM